MGLVRVGAFVDHGEARAARGHLEGHGIDTEVSGDDGNQVGPSTSFAQVVLLVPESQAEDAQQLLAESDGDAQSSSIRMSRTELLVAVGLLVFILGLVVVGVAFS